MRNHPYLPTLFALVFLIGGCTMPAVHDPSQHPPNKAATTGASSPPEKPAPTVHAETKGKRVSLIPQENAGPATKSPQPGKTPAPAKAAPPPPQIYTDYNTGLTFSYQRPWHLVSTQGTGPILGRDGHSQLTARFISLTTDKDKDTQPGYFYVPGESIATAIGNSVQSMLNAGEKQPARGKTPLDVLLTQRHFPNLIIEKRYRGNDGGVVVQKCRHKQLPGQIQVYHIFIGDKVASFSLSEVKNRQLKLEMQQIVLSTKKP